jgi:hypothetical protein
MNGYILVGLAEIRSRYTAYIMFINIRTYAHASVRKSVQKSGYLFFPVPVRCRIYLVISPFKFMQTCHLLDRVCEY